MKTLFALLLGVCLASTGCSQVSSSSVIITQEATDLEKLVAPIALYPDSLVALILPAATNPSEVVLAARYLADGGSVSQADAQPWNQSVKSLIHYPALLKWMDDNLAWTQAIGEEFADSPTDVMNAIQHLRAKARVDGILAETPEQRIVVAGDIIYILPARSDLIYIPSYDPDIFWVRRPSHGYLTFSAGFTIGSWLFYDCDWARRSIWMHHRHTNWIYRPGWRPHIHPSPGTYWTAGPRPHRPPGARHTHTHGVPRTSRFIVPTPGDHGHAGRRDGHDGRPRNPAVIAPHSGRTSVGAPPPEVRNRENPTPTHRSSGWTPNASNQRYQQRRNPEVGTSGTNSDTNRPQRSRPRDVDRHNTDSARNAPAASNPGRHGGPGRSDPPRTSPPRPTRTESPPPPRAEPRPTPPAPRPAEARPAPQPAPAPAQEASSQDQTELRARGAVRRR